ncbi:hypothetical protein D3C76_1530340 [compost metagenome]
MFDINHLHQFFFCTNTDLDLRTFFDNIAFFSALVIDDTRFNTFLVHTDDLITDDESFLLKHFPSFFFCLGDHVRHGYFRYNQHTLDIPYNAHHGD